MTETPIRVGIVGAGANTRERHIPGLREQAGVEIVSVCNRRRTSTDAVAAASNIPHVYDDWEALVSAPDTNAIVVGTWPNLHAPVTVAALAAGKHVLCEARMAMTLADARQMEAVARQQPTLVAQVVPAPFTLGVDRMVQRLMREGYVGDPLSVVVRANPGTFLDHDGPLTWRRDERLSGVNIMSMGIWYECVMRWVGEAREVMALGRVFVSTRTDPATGQPQAVRVPEHLDVLGTLECGAQLQMQVSSVQGLRPESEIQVFGSEGTLRFADGVLTGARRGDKALAPLAPLPSEAHDGWRVEAEFVGAIRGREPVRLTDFATGVRYMAFTEAVSHSLREGCRIPVEA